MKRFGFVLLGTAIVLGLVWSQVSRFIEPSFNRVQDHAPYAISAEARDRHGQLVIADLHADSLLWDRDLLSRSRRGHVDVPRLVEGNVAIQVFAAVTKTPAGLNYEENRGDSDRLTQLVIAQQWPRRTWGSLYQRALHQARRLADAAAREPDALRILRTRGDLDALLAARADGSRQVGALLATEGSHALEGELANVAGLHEAGYRMMGLHHFFDNELGGSLHGQSGAGLTDFGRAVVEELDRRRILLDVAHSSEAVVEEVLGLTRRPVVVSHTGVKGACDTPRNIRDELMQRIAARGGLVGVGYWDGAACDISPVGVVRSLRYAIDLLGADHVALGSDYDGSTEVAFDTSELAVLTQEMIRAGFTAEEIRKVMGANVVRVFRELLPPG